ncbi:unnamed protein product [Lactuca virosa]|uniref:Pre-mRNA processing factor 4 (PRP4)-like domain-containing protein n=1 Tax=Lactuca virosa TaxID=75947 RepID=A0AAU9MZB3_9ASTR|nr:unnamed protein product [Lactuca virosa]
MVTNQALNTKPQKIAGCLERNRRLRQLGEPVKLFGEREKERRDRLRMIMAKLDSEGQLETPMKILEEEEVVVNAAGMDDGGRRRGVSISILYRRV